MNIEPDPAAKDFYPSFQAPSFNTIDGMHYGVSLQFGPNVLLYKTKDFKTAPTSWSVIYTPPVPRQDHGPRQPDPDRRRRAVSEDHEADARHHRPLRADAAAVQRRGRPARAAAPLIKKYWALASEEIFAFKTAT